MRTHALKYLDQGLACDPSIGNGPDRLNIFTYVDFFDTILICVNEAVCDERTAYEFFERYANYHWPGFRKHIEIHRRYEKEFGVRTEYGAGLEKMARHPTDAFTKCPTDR